MDHVSHLKQRVLVVNVTLREKTKYTREFGAITAHQFSSIENERGFVEVGTPQTVDDAITQVYESAGVTGLAAFVHQLVSHKLDGSLPSGVDKMHIHVVTSGLKRSEEVEFNRLVEEKINGLGKRADLFSNCENVQLQIKHRITEPTIDKRYAATVATGVGTQLGRSA